MKLKLMRKVTKQECRWLKRDYKKWEILYSYSGCTNGCISPNGIACTEEKDKEPFFEIPGAALVQIIEK